MKNIGRLESNLVSVERIKTYTEVEQEVKMKPPSLTICRYTKFPDFNCAPLGVV